MSNPGDSFRINLSALLQAKGLSQSDLGRAMGVTASMVNQYLAGKSTPGLDVLTRFATALGVQAWELIKPSGAEPTPKDSNVGEILLSHLPPETRRLIDLALKADPAAIRIATISLEGATEEAPQISSKKRK